MKSLALLSLVFAAFPHAGFADELYTQKGEDPSFAEVLKSGKLTEGENSKNGVTGSKISVNNKLVELTKEAKRAIPENIKIHTLGNSAIRRSDFAKWSRWYQEHGSTQVFRLFKGEVNVRNDRDLAARVEAFSELKWQRGDWHEWSGTYTIIKPHGAAIFQAKNGGDAAWSVQINMNSSGDVILNHRRGKDVVIAKAMTGKPFHIRVRDNGHDYEVFYEGKLVGKDSWARTEGETSFRWGMYLGANEVKNDVMIFVSGVAIDGK